MPEELDLITSEPLLPERDASPVPGLATHPVSNEGLLMPDPTAPFQPGKSSPGLVLEVSKFPFDWGTSQDPGDLTEERLALLGDRIFSGAWFLNPICVVHAPTPSAAFFRAALKTRSQWLRTARQAMSNHGQRHRAREAEQRGRRVGYLEILSTHPGKGRVPSSDESPWLSDLTDEQRAEILASGKLARQFAFSGLMIIDGNHVPPRTWQAQADQVLHPDRPRITTVRRRIDLATLKATNDLEPLKRTAREALQAHLDHHPNDVVFVTPQATISAPSATPAFYVKADQLKATWCTLLKRTLGSGTVRRLRRAADQETLALVFSGTLIEGGSIYLPGYWPNHAPKPGQRRKTPFQSPTVPPSYLGLLPSDHPNAIKPSDPHKGTH
jgi:hypothetical protein